MVLAFSRIDNSLYQKDVILIEENNSFNLYERINLKPVYFKNFDDQNSAYKEFEVLASAQQEEIF